MRKYPLFFLLFILPVVSATAFSGVKIKMETLRSSTPEPERGWIYIQNGDRLRVDVDLQADSGDPKTSVIYRADVQTMYMLNHEDHSYLRMDRESMKKLAGQMSEAHRQMQEQLQQMPEAQRKMMEEMMKKQMPQRSQTPQKAEIRAAGKEEGLRKFEIWVGGEKREEMWVDEAESSGIPQQELEVFEKMSQFYLELMESFADNPFFEAVQANPFVWFNEVEGFPVRILDLESGDDTRISKGVAEQIPAARFEVPADYRENRASWQ